MRYIVLWDIPTRLSHWLLVLAVAFLFMSGVLGGGLMEWHGKIGVLVIALVAFRIVWGFLGSTYARFSQFFPTPAKILAYLKGEWRGLGHNPLGALSVFALLTLALIQALTGLFATDEISVNGPLYPLIAHDLALAVTGAHQKLAWIFCGVIALHVASIAFYKIVKKDNLLFPMLTGKKEVSPKDEDKAARGGGWGAFVAAVFFAALAFCAASGVWNPEPPPAPAPAVTDTPDW
ncbi:MAG: cytochrome b/b6 domain-containing protein [Zoogloeaceae bacterium]|jgi:cytochrome b|nr:cytochrome b/b6 domain-containing protein [Zoogloeaceae bacterium]